ncbi:MAG TPA: hypothetical protein VFA09_26200 [Ktedonobacteraceae bacterium]|jgi:hypothetical protein|nr:hypothetical protein [Ktedonobacteraceae bacterium]
MGDQQTAHPRAIPPNFLRNALSPPLEPSGLRPFSSLETLWRRSARQPAVVWLHGDALTVEYEEIPLAQYTVRYQPDHKHFKEVPEAKRFETPYHSPQGQLWELDETMWRQPNISQTAP